MALEAPSIDNLDLIRKYANTLLNAGTPMHFDLKALESAVEAGGGHVSGGPEKQLLKVVCKEILDNGQETFVRRWRAKKLLELIDKDTKQKEDEKRNRFVKKVNNANSVRSNKQSGAHTQRGPNGAQTAVETGGQAEKGRPGLRRAPEATERRWAPTTGAEDREDSVAVGRVAAEALANDYFLDKMVEGGGPVHGAEREQEAHSSVLDGEHELRERSRLSAIGWPAPDPLPSSEPVAANPNLSAPAPQPETHILRMVPANVQPTQGATSLSKVVKSGLQNGGLECTAKVAGQQDPKPDRQNPAPHYRQPWEAFAGAADERDGGGKAHADARADVQVADEMSSNRGHWSGGAVNRAEPPGDENARGFYSLQDPLSGYAGPFWFERQLAGPDGFFRYPQSYTSNAGESENPCFSVESGAGEEMADGQESGESRGTGALKRSWEDGGSDMGGRAKRASLGSGQWASAVRDAEMQDLADDLPAFSSPQQRRSSSHRAPPRTPSAAAQTDPRKNRSRPRARRVSAVSSQTPPAADSLLDSLFPALERNGRRRSLLVGHSTEDEPSIFTLAPQFDEGADWVRQGLWKTPPPAAAPQPLIATGSLSRQHTSGPGLEMQPGTFLQAAERSGATSGNGASEGASEEERLAGLTMIALTLEEQAPGLGLTAVNPSANPGICAGIPSTRSNFPEESAGRPRSSPPVQGSGFAESQQKSNPPGFLADSQGFAPPVPHNWLQLGRASHHTPATVGASHPVGVNRHYDNQPEPSSDQASAQPEPVPGPGMTQPEPIYGQRLAQPDPVSGHTVTQPEPVAGQGLTQPEPIVGQQPEQGVQRFAPVLASEKVGSIFGVSPAPVILPFKKRRWGVGSAGGGLTRASDRQPHTANIWEGDECKDERAARGGERKGSLQCEGKDGEGVRQAWAERSLASVPWQAYLARGAETGGEQETDWDGSEKEIGAASESEEYEESADFEDGAEYKLCGEHGMGFEEGWEGGSLGTGYRQGYESGYGESVACHGGFTNPSSAPSAQVGPRLEGCFWDGLAGNVWTSGYSSRGATQSGQFGDRARSGGLKGPGGETWSGGDGRVGMWSSARRSVQNTEKDEGVADSSMSEGFDERADNALRRHVGRWGIPQETRSWANAREAGSPEESFGTGHGSAHLSWGADVGMAGSPRHKKRLGSS